MTLLVLVDLVPLEVGSSGENCLADVAGEVGRRAVRPVLLEIQKVVKLHGSSSRAVRAEEDAVDPHVHSKDGNESVADLA